MSVRDHNSEWLKNWREAHRRSTCNRVRPQNRSRCRRHPHTCQSWRRCWLRVPNNELVPTSVILGQSAHRGRVDFATYPVDARLDAYPLFWHPTMVGPLTPVGEELSPEEELSDMLSETSLSALFTAASVPVPWRLIAGWLMHGVHRSRKLCPRQHPHAQSVQDIPGLSVLGRPKAPGYLVGASAAVVELATAVGAQLS